MKSSITNDNELNRSLDELLVVLIRNITNELVLDIIVQLLNVLALLCIVVGHLNLTNGFVLVYDMEIHQEPAYGSTPYK